MAASGSARKLRVLVDTNVVLDQVLRREPWFTEAQPFWQARDAGLLTAYLPASALTDIFYISRRQAGNDDAKRAVARCLDEFGFVAVYRALLDSAMALPGSDFEDNLQIACAQATQMDLIVTRDKLGFRGSPVLATEPAEIVKHLPA
jgi:predicted nucleic acid-binding protein